MKLQIHEMNQYQKTILIKSRIPFPVENIFKICNTAVGNPEAAFWQTLPWFGHPHGTNTKW